MTGRPWVLVSGDFVPDGGQDMANLALALRLDERSYPVHVVTHRVAPELARRPGVTLHQAPRPLGSHLLGGVLLDRLGRRTARTHTDARVVVNGANCSWFDVCWVHCVHSAYRLPRPQPGERRRWLRTRAAQQRNRRREREQFSRARLVIANSERTRRDLTRLGVGPERLSLVPLGVDPERFGPVTPAERLSARGSLGVDPERPVVVFVGALGALDMKGIDTLIAAWASLCTDAGWTAELLIAGSGRTAEWRRRADTLGLGQRVRFLGRVSRVEDLLAAADLLVHPTRYDSYGLAVHEALCRGCPVIVSKAAGVSERLTGALQRLVLDDPEDSRALADLLREALRDLDRYRTAATNLGDELRRWSWTDMADRFVEATERA